MFRFTAPRPLLRATAAVAALLALSAAPAHAQRPPARSVLVLQVTDERGKPVSDAYVTVGGVEYGGLTNSRGEARVYGIGEGNRLIQVARQGFAFGRVPADFTGRDTVQRQVRLTPQPVELPGVTATSWGRSMRLRQVGFYHRQRAGWGAYMTRDRIDQLQPYRSTDIFRYMRGFTVIHTGRGAQSMVVSTRGVANLSQRVCVPIVFVDGMLTARASGDAAALLDLIPPQDLEAVEAYAGIGTIPAEYNPTGSACGVILLWTRNGS